DIHQGLEPVEFRKAQYPSITPAEQEELDQQQREREELEQQQREQEQQQEQQQEAPQQQEQQPQ
ncbi:MAG: hypothetical protein IKZ65_04905, partial [Lachnospiraceae bacterium]|nr:hypothetical protein [Lachnospiraceae bacterium]